MRNIDALTYFKGDDLAAKVWTDKYALRNEKGEIVESNPDQMHLRMAKEFARVEEEYQNGNESIKPSYKELSSYGKTREKLTEEKTFFDMKLRMLF